MISKLWKDSSFRYALAGSFFWVLVCHAYAFFNDLFSHDVLNALYASGVEERWKVELGRFLFPVYRTIVRGKLALPWVIGLLTILWICLTVYLLAKIFELHSFAAVFFTSGFLAINRTMFCLGATYLYELDVDMLSVFLAVLAVYLWKNRKFGFLWGALPLIGTLGIYQCNISVSVVLILFTLVLALVQGKMDTAAAFRKGLLSLAMLALGSGLYLLIYQIVQAVTGIHVVHGYYNSITNILEPKTRGLFSLIIGTYRDFIKTIFYAQTSYPNILIYLAILLVSALSIIWLVRMIRQNSPKPLAICLAVILLLLIPLGANTAYILNNGNVHDLMKYAVWIVFLFPIVLAEKAGKEIRRHKRLAVGVYIALVLVLADFTVSANSIYLKKNLEQHATLSLMTRVIYDLNETPGYVRGETPICFIGAPDLDRQMPGFGTYYNFTGNWSGSAIASDNYEYFYHPYRMYIQYYLNEPVTFCSIEEYNALKSNSQVAAMSAYPAPDSIGFVNGILVIKLK